MAQATATYIPDPTNPQKMIINPALPENIRTSTPSYENRDQTPEQFAASRTWTTPSGAVVDASGKLITTPPGVYADSSAIKAGEDALKSNIGKYTLSQVEIDAAKKTSMAQQQLIQDRLTQLDQRRQAEIASIESSYQKGVAGTEEAQRKEVGTTSMGLARMGGYLGGSASQQAVLQNLELTHRQELSLLKDKMNESIRKANNAYEDQDFKLAQESMTIVKDLEKTIEDRRNTFFNQMLNLSQEMRATVKDRAVMADDEITRYVESGETPDTDTLIKLASNLGTNTSTILSLIKAKQAISEAKSEKEQYDSYNSIIGMLQKIPLGVEMQMPDGTTLTGMGDSGDIYTTIQKNTKTGEAFLISYDKRQNKVVEKRSLGNFGATVSTTGGPSAPTIYGLTKEQSTDVAISDTPPDWFVNQAKMQLEVTNITPEASNKLWSDYRKDVMAKTKSVKEKLGTGFTIDWSGGIPTEVQSELESK